ncbi:hypothetical protein MMC22_004696 [Lobaria immixta]|nr:hypothetical protein [Lobaria immixta]
MPSSSYLNKRGTIQDQRSERQETELSTMSQEFGAQLSTMGQEVSKTLSEVERIAEKVGKVERTMPSGLRQVSETPGVNSRMAPNTRSGIGALPEGIPPQGHLKPEEVLTPGLQKTHPWATRSIRKSSTKLKDPRGSAKHPRPHR